MFTTIDHFTHSFESEIKNTVKMLDILTDESLSRPEHPDLRSLGRAAWHLVTVYPEMCNQFGIAIEGSTDKDLVPSSASRIKEAYLHYTGTVMDAIKKWTDADLQREDDMYGETWKRGFSLWVLMIHEIHHRGQMTILMRLAGLPVPGVYGPSREEWAEYGASPPSV